MDNLELPITLYAYRIL